MKDLTDKRLIYRKGFLFLFIGVFSSALLILENLELRFIVLYLAAIWGFCRFYYFAFYVIEKYVDPSYKFSSLWSFVMYWMKKK
ncbi:MAG: hypothetical protein AAGA18_10910 [Verrucomicrobiota bacterium]